MVAVDSTNLGPFENLAWVAGWKLQAQVGRLSQRQVIATYDPQVLQRHPAGNGLASPNQWTSAPDFSLAAGTDQTNSSAVDTAYAGLAQWLTAYIQDGIDRPESGPSVAFYENFKNIVTDSEWNGVIGSRSGPGGGRPASRDRGPCGRHRPRQNSRHTISASR